MAKIIFVVFIFLFAMYVSTIIKVWYNGVKGIKTVFVALSVIPMFILCFGRVLLLAFKANPKEIAPDVTRMDMLKVAILEVPNLHSLVVKKISSGMQEEYDYELSYYNDRINGLAFKAI